MPEGPSIFILKEAVKEFTGKTVVLAEGNTKAIDLSLLKNEPIIEFKKLGKTFSYMF